MTVSKMMIFSSIGVSCGILIAVLFSFYQVHTAVWGGLSGLLALHVFIHQIIAHRAKKSGTIPHDPTWFMEVGVFGFFISVIFGCCYYAHSAITNENHGISSHYPTCVWAFMTAKWAYSMVYLVRAEKDIDTKPHKFLGVCLILLSQMVNLALFIISLFQGYYTFMLPFSILVLIVGIAIVVLGQLKHSFINPFGTWLQSFLMWMILSTLTSAGVVAAYTFCEYKDYLFGNIIGPCVLLVHFLVLVTLSLLNRKKYKSREQQIVLDDDDNVDESTTLLQEQI